MKILNHYSELIIAVDSQDTQRFEKLLAYSDCRNDLINKYIKNYGTENINLITKSIEAKALKNELEKICSECENTLCKFCTQSSKKFTKIRYIHEENILSNQKSHQYQINI